MTRSIRASIAFTVGVALMAYTTVLLVKHSNMQRHFNTLSLSREDVATQSCIAHDNSQETRGYFAGCGGFF